MPFTVLLPGAPVILDFEPTTYPLDGGVTLSARLQGFDPSAAAEDYAIRFKGLQDGVVNVTSFVLAGSVATVSGRLPAATAAATCP